MNEAQGGPNNIIDITDCLEAVGVFRGWKNFFFLLVLLCILLLQVSFWLVDLGYVDTGQARSVAPVEQAAPVDANKPAADANDVVVDANDAVGDANDAAKAGSKQPGQKGKNLFGLNITFDHLTWVINISNAVLILTSLLYFLSIMFCLKVSLIGRLGGISHIARAFFISLIMVVLLFPWQKVFGGMVMGAIFTPCELVKCRTAFMGRDALGDALYYLRFSGFMVLTLLLLFISQIRSCRWTRAILRRLEVI